MMDDMALPEHDQKNVDAFFAAVKALEPAFKYDSFSYIAVKHEGAFILLQAALQRHVAKPALPYTVFSTEHVRAGNCLLKDIGQSPRQFVEALFAGSVKVHGAELKFPGDYSNARSTYFSPFWAPALQGQSRANTLQISGAQQATFIRQPMLDWELRAATTPYDNIQELMNEFQLGTLQGSGAVHVLVIAHTAAMINGASGVNDDSADIGIRLAHDLKKKDAAIGIRMLTPGSPIKRMQIAGKDLKWAKTPECNLGTMRIQVPKASILQCFAIYGGDTQSYYWVSDPATTHNARRTALHAYDPRLDKLRDILIRDSYRGSDARDFEVGISWLVWLLGFSAAHLSATKTSDAPDIIVSSPNGNIAVVECTTGLLKAENKLANLHDRVQAMRRSFEASGYSNIRILPVIVTAKSRNDVAADLEQAEKLGILVFTRENIENALNRSFVPQNAEQLYAEWEQAVSMALAKYNSQGGLPPGS